MRKSCLGSQCPITDLSKRFVPKPMTTTGWKGTPAPKESKSPWIEILHGGSQFTLWFLKIKLFQKFSDHSEIFFCLTIHKKLNKSYTLDKIYLFLKKKIVSVKKTYFENFSMFPNGFQTMLIIDQKNIL